MKSKGILDEITRKTIARVLETDGFIGKMTANDILSALLAAEEEIEGETSKKDHFIKEFGKWKLLAEQRGLEIESLKKEADQANRKRCKYCRNSVVID